MEDSLIIDPILPKELDALEFTYTCFGKVMTFRYHVENSDENPQKGIKVSSNGLELEGKVLDNPYRRGGLQISKEELEKGSLEIDIYL